MEDLKNKDTNLGTGTPEKKELSKKSVSQAKNIQKNTPLDTKTQDNALKSKVAAQADTAKKAVVSSGFEKKTAPADTSQKVSAFKVNEAKAEPVGSAKKESVSTDSEKAAAPAQTDSRDATVMADAHVEEKETHKLEKELDSTLEQAEILRKSEENVTKKTSDKTQENNPAEESAQHPVKDKEIPMANTGTQVQLTDNSRSVSTEFISDQVSSLKGKVNILTCLLILIIGCSAFGIYYLDKVKYQDIITAQKQIESSQQAIQKTEGKVNDIFEQLKLKDAKMNSIITSNEELKNQNSILKNTEESLIKQTENALKMTEAVNIRLNDFEDHNPSDWLIAQSFFLVSNAQNILSFSDNVNAALLNLEKADALLVKIDENEVSQIRESINNDILALKRLEQIDFKGISFKISGVYNSLDTMPLNEFLDEAQKKDAYGKNSETTDKIQDWKQNLINSLKDFSSRFIEVRRRSDGEVNQYLSPQQSAILAQNLKTELLLSKIALFNHDQQSFRHNIEEVIKHISAYYDVENVNVKANIEALKEIVNLDISAAAPDSLKCYELFNKFAQKKFNLYKTQNKAESETPLAAVSERKVTTIAEKKPLKAVKKASSKKGGEI